MMSDKGCNDDDNDDDDDDNDVKSMTVMVEAQQRVADRYGW